MSTATVVIPTTGAATLDQAVQSVRSQTHKDTRCWVVIDGPEFAVAAGSIISRYPDVTVLQLPENVGGDGYYGHRVYAAVGHLINTDYLLYLDQDNWMDADHVETMINAIETSGSDWSHSLRKVCDKDGGYLLDDNCESLGKWPAWINEQVFLVDTSCYCIKRDVISKISSVWHGKWGQDRVFLANMMHHFPKFVCNKKHSLNYRLDGNVGSVTKDFFVQGNAAMSQRHPNGFPWI